MMKLYWLHETRLGLYGRHLKKINHNVVMF